MVVTTIRELTVSEWADFIRDEIALMIDRKSKNCLNCTNFDTNTQFCRKANAMPPPLVAVKGCELWEEEIPF